MYARIIVYMWIPVSLKATGRRWPCNLKFRETETGRLSVRGYPSIPIQILVTCHTTPKPTPLCFSLWFALAVHEVPACVLLLMFSSGCVLAFVAALPLFETGFHVPQSSLELDNLICSRGWPWTSQVLRLEGGASMLCSVSLLPSPDSFTSALFLDSSLFPTPFFPHGFPAVLNLRQWAPLPPQC